MIQRLLFALICLFVLSSCAHTRVSLLTPQGVSCADEIQTRFIQQLRAKDRQIFSAKMLARATISQASERYGLKYAIVFQKPDSLRLETLPVNGGYPLQLLTAYAGEQVLLDSDSKTAYRAKADQNLIRTMLKLPLQETQLMSLLTGRVPSESLSSERRFRFYCDQDSSALMIFDEQEGAIWVLDTRDFSLRIAQFHTVTDEVPTLEVKYGEQIEISGIPVPRNLSLSLPQENFSLELQINSAQLNGEFRPEIFSVAIPSDFSISESLIKNND